MSGKNGTHDPDYTIPDSIPAGKQLLSTGEVALLLGKSVDTIRRYYRDSGLPGVRQGVHGHMVFDRQAVMVWWRRFCVSPAGEVESRAKSA